MIILYIAQPLYNILGKCQCTDLHKRVHANQHHVMLHYKHCSTLDEDGNKRTSCVDHQDDKHYPRSPTVSE